MCSIMRRRLFKLCLVVVILTSIFFIISHKKLPSRVFLGELAYIDKAKTDAKTPSKATQVTGSSAQKSTTSQKPPPKVTKKQENFPCLLGQAPLKPSPPVRLTSEPNVTVVTAFFDIGRFRKGGGNVFFDPNLYERWAAAYGYMQNPLIVYTDSERFEKKFLDMRKNLLNRTQVLRINRTSLWAFQFLDRIKPIYARKDYPKHHPNTVVPEYSCAQHAKYACVENAITKNIFNTTYITWLDIGYFRFLAGQKKKFVIFPPKDFDDKKLAVNLVYPTSNLKAPPADIFKNNAVWIGGGMFFGERSVVKTFISDYRIAVERYLNQSLSNTDQQVLFSMNTEAEKKVLKPRVELQIYKWDVRGDCWFYLGYSCYREVL